MRNIVTSLKRVYSWLARVLTREPEIYCSGCGKYKKMVGVTHHPDYRIVEYTLECGHTIWEKEEKQYFRALDKIKEAQDAWGKELDERN